MTKSDVLSTLVAAALAIIFYNGLRFWASVTSPALLIMLSAAMALTVIAMLQGLIYLIRRR